MFLKALAAGFGIVLSLIIVTFVYVYLQAPAPPSVYLLVTMEDGLFFSYLLSRQTFESDVLAPVSSPFCQSPPPESREIANELAHGLLSSIRVCGKCAGTQYKTSLNQPKTQMLNAMFSRL